MVDVRSEVGRLERVLVHEPGLEVDHMVPAMMEELLFDDILFGDRAREEHARFRRVLQLLRIEIVDAEDLLVDTLRDPNAREWILDAMLEGRAASARKLLEDLPPDALAVKLVGGVRSDPKRDRLPAGELFLVPPLPNWCFQRDPQVILGDGIIYAAMATEARARESLLSRAIFRFHPELAATRTIHDPLEAATPRSKGKRAGKGVLEGGDVLVLSPDVIAVGLSERTDEAGVRGLARALHRNDGGPRWMFVVAIPQRRAYMHLDTILTPIDADACLVYPPVIAAGGAESAEVFEIDLHAAELTRVARPDLLGAMARRGVSLTPVPCGGDDPLAQQREQWTDGANALALAPGVITLYDRNVGTMESLARHGFRLVEAEDLLLGREELDLDDRPGRVCIVLSSHELSRARGGPHCLTHPLVRAAV